MVRATAGESATAADTRGVSPVLGTILLVGVTVVLALSVGAALTTQDLDETLTEFETVWAAAGSSNAVFPIAPEILVECADATIADVVE